MHPVSDSRGGSLSVTEQDKWKEILDLLNDISNVTMNMGSLGSFQIGNFKCKYCLTAAAVENIYIVLRLS